MTVTSTAKSQPEPAATGVKTHLSPAVMGGVSWKSWTE